MRVFTAVVALVCLVTGYALAGTRVKALEDVSPARFPGGITVGTRVALWFGSSENGGTIYCTIARIDAGWVRCAATDVDPFKTVEQHESWYALARVISVDKLEPKR